MIIWLALFTSVVFVLSIIIIGFKWKRLKMFFHNDNYTYFDICFLSLYFIEQAIFIIISYFCEEYNILLTGLFALIVISTVSAQKIMMESKSKKLSGISTIYIEKLKLLKEKYEEQINNLRGYIEILEEDNPYLEEGNLK
jgi:hypothetical protein